MTRVDLSDFRSRLPPEFTSDEAREVLAGRYRAPLKLLGALEKAGTLVRLKRGLYAWVDGFEPIAAANIIHAPSYVSFETALDFHGLIPERVNVILSVVDGRPVVFESAAGRFEYRSQSRALFSRGMTMVEISERRALMATPEKALLDTLVSARLDAARLEPADITRFVCDSMRVELDALLALRLRHIRTMAPLYRSLAPRKLVQGLRLLRASRAEQRPNSISEGDRHE